MHYLSVYCKSCNAIMGKSGLSKAVNHKIYYSTIGGTDSVDLLFSSYRPSIKTMQYQPKVSGTSFIIHTEFDES